MKSPSTSKQISSKEKLSKPGSNLEGLKGFGLTFLFLGLMICTDTQIFLLPFPNHFLAAIIYGFEPISESSDLSTVFRINLRGNIEMLPLRRSLILWLRPPQHLSHLW